MGSMCKCVKKRETINEERKDESDDNFEDNCKMIEEIMSKLNGVNLCHTGIWPDSDKYSVYNQSNDNKNIPSYQVKEGKALNKTTREICVTYDLNIPLIRKDRYIFTAKEYFAAKKILKFFKKLKA